MFTQRSGTVARPRSFWIGVVVTLVISTLLIAGALALAGASQEDEVGAETVLGATRHPAPAHVPR